MKIASIQSFNGRMNNVPSEPVKSPQTQPEQGETKSINLNNMPNANSYLMNFKGTTDVSQYIRDKEVRIDDITKVDNSLHIGLADMPPKKAHLNASGINVKKKVGNETTQYVISNDKKDPIFIATIKNDAGELPQLTYKQGKFMPEVTVKHSSLGEGRIKMLAGSEIKGKDFSLVMPGNIFHPNGGIENVNVRNGISFKGNLAVSTLNLEPKTKNAVELYMNSDISSKVTPGAYADEVRDMGMAVAVPAGGFGERLYNFTRDLENKPSMLMATSDNMRLMGNALSLLSSGGFINDDESDKITYLSQNNEIDGDNVIHTGKYKSDGGALAEGIEKGAIDASNGLAVVNADIITNADLSRVAHALKTLPDAALVIPYYPVPEERAKSFGLIGVEQDEQGNMMMKQFVEKPPFISTPPVPPTPNECGTDEEYNEKMQKYIENMTKYEDAQYASEPGTGKYLANPGMYFMSKEAAEVLKDMKDNAGLGGNVMPAIVKLCNEGKLLNAEGKPMKAYTVPLQRADGQIAFWDDAGTAEAYLKILKDIAFETTSKGTGPDNKYYGLPEFMMQDFAKNSDLESGIVYRSDKAKDIFNTFKEAFGVEEAKGNIYVVD